ncbi:MAG: hypothetical protein FJX75_11745 [Armatimonadetes bacterium]|nr:hypothetical protein [Armatimonadota bacterium]
MDRHHSAHLRLAVATLAFILLTAALTTSAALAQSITGVFGGIGVFPENCTMNSQRWFGCLIDYGTNNTVRNVTFGGASGGPFNPNMQVYYPGMGVPAGPRPDDLDGVAVTWLPGNRMAVVIGPFTGGGSLHNDWCMGTFGGGTGINYVFDAWILDQNGNLLNNGNPYEYIGSYSTLGDNADVLEWYASPALGVDPLAVSPNQLQPDNDNGAGDSTYTWRVQYACGRNTSITLPPRWGWTWGNGDQPGGDNRVQMICFDRLPERAPIAADASLTERITIGGLQRGDYAWTYAREDDTWLDKTGDYTGIKPPSGTDQYQFRTAGEVALFLDGNIQRPHFMLRENPEDNEFRDNAGARYRYVIQPTDYMNFLDNLFQFRYDPPGPDNQDQRALGVYGTSTSNGYVSLPPGGHTYEFAATDDMFPPRGVAYVQIGWPGNQTRAEFWHPRPETPAWNDSAQQWWEREAIYTRQIRPFGYPYDSQDPTQYPNVNPVLSGFPYFNWADPPSLPAALSDPYLSNGVYMYPESGIAPDWRFMRTYVRTGGEPRLVPTIMHEMFNTTTAEYDLFDVVSPFESVGPQGGPTGSTPGVGNPSRPNQPTHYTNDDTIRPNWGNIWPEAPADPTADPLSGGKWTAATKFTLLVNYWRNPSRSPDFIQCKIRRNNRGSAPGPWVSYTMQQLNPADTDYGDGAVFQFQISADQLPGGGGPGDYNYYFVASDGTRTTIFPNRPPRYTDTETGNSILDFDPLLPASNPQVDAGVPLDDAGNNDYYWFRVNNPPVLSDNDVQPTSDRVGANFVYYVTYQDIDGEVLNPAARGDEPFEASIHIDLFGDPQGENRVAGVSAGTLAYTTQIGPGYAANSLVDAVRPYYVRIEEAANPAAIGLTYQITSNSTTQIQATPVPPAAGIGVDPITSGDRFEILQWFTGMMDRVNPADDNAVDGIRYWFNTANNITLGPGLHRYYFTFRDDWGNWAYPDNPDVSVEGEQVRFPQSSEFEGPEVLQNTAPVLSNYRFTPDAPGTGPDGTTATGFQFYVTYTDAENDPPQVIRLGIDGTQASPAKVLNMVPSNPNDTVYTDGAVFETPAVRLTAGNNHVFRAQATDGELSYPVRASPSDPLLFVGERTSVGPPPVYADSKPGPKVAQNTPPVLEFEANDAPPGQPSPGLNPDAGTQATTFTYHIIYKDLDVFAGVQGNPPIWVRVYIDKQATDMVQVNPADTDYTDGALFEATATGLVAGTAHTYYFLANDGLDNARQPALTATPNKFPGPRVDEPPGPAKTLTVQDVPNDQGGATQGSFNPSNDDGGGADDVTEYRVYYDTSAAMNSPILAVTVPATGAGSYSFTHTTAPKQTDLWYVVRAWDDTNESIDSNIAGPVRATDNIPPDAPTNLTATNPGLGTEIDLAWSKSADDPNAGADDVIEYRVYRAQSSGGYGASLATLPAGTISYQDTTAADGVNFFYVVRAFDGENESVNSNEAGPVMSTDNSPPTLSNLDPAPNARNVPVDTNISFTATDTGAGVDPTSRKIDATVGGVAVLGVTSQATVPNGYRFTLDPNNDFTELDVVQVRIEVSDLATPTPRTVVKNYRFTIVPPPTYAISGTITQDDGKGGLEGVPNATVYAGVLSATTDSNGVYTILGLTNGSYQVVPTKRGKAFIPASRNVTVASADVPGVDFTAVPGYDITGHVRDKNGVVANVRVTNGLKDAVTNVRGAYTIKDSPAGQYVVRPALPGSVFKPTERVVTLPGTGTNGAAQQVDFYASPETFSVSGRVSTADGGVLAGAKLAIETKGSTPTLVGTGRTDIGGAYIVSRVPAGTYNVRPEKTNFTFEPNKLEVTVGPNARDNDFVAFEVFATTYPAGLSFLAIPVDPVNDDIVAALGTNLVARWDPTRGGADKYVYAVLEPNNPILDLAPGRGYFAKFGADQPVQVAGRLMRTSDMFSLNLQEGFNMAGNPYPATLPWANLAIAATGPVADFGFILKPGTRDYQLVTDNPALIGRGTRLTVPRGAGFWIESDQPTSVLINGPGTAAVADEAPPPKTDARNWIIPIVASTAMAADSSSRAGVIETSGAGIQVGNPPTLSETVDLYFTGTGGRPLACDVRPATGAAKMEWPFAVWTDLKNAQVAVQLPDLSAVPADLRVTLVDEDANRRVYARTMAAYAYDSGDGGLRHFRLIVEPDRGGALVITAAATQARTRTVEISYTLSRQAAVSISILNIAGREIATIQRGQDTAAGANTAVWNLKSATGAPVPSGAYVVVFKAVAEDGQQATTLKTVNVQR